MSIGLALAIAFHLLGTGVHPEEVVSLRWEFVRINGSGGLIQVSERKSRAARRLLPMLPDVHRMLTGRDETQGKPAEGWVFPSTARDGHLEQGTRFHAGADRRAQVPSPITQRYCHPQADAVETAFSKFGNREELVTEAGHDEKQLPPSTDREQPLNILAT